MSVTAPSKALGILGKVGITLFLSVFIVVGSWVSWEMLQDTWELQEMRRTWQQGEARILESRVVEVSDGHQAVVRYEYGVDGRVYTGDSIRPGYEKDSDFQDANNLAARYSKGARVPVWFHPENPADVHLEIAQDSLEWLGLLFPLFFIGIPLVILFAVWKSGASPARAEDVSVPMSEKAGKKDQGFLVMAIMATVFSLVGLGMLVFWTVPLWAEMVRSYSYVETPCVIESSRVRTHSSSDGTTYSVEIIYRYQWEGETHRSGRYDLMSGSSSGRDGKREVVARYPRGAQRLCYVNPGRPHEAVLVRGFKPIYLLSLMPLFFLGAGLGIGFVALRKDSKPRNPGSASPDIDAQAGPAELKPKMPPWLAFVSVLLVCLFWNGLISVFLGEVWRGFDKGSPDWSLTVFMIPFVLVGLFLVGAVVYQGAALFNPRVKLALGNATPRLGGALRVGWHCTGNRGRLASFTIALEGREVFVYTSGSGKNSSRVRQDSLFYRQELVATSSPEEIRRGMVDVSLPSTGAAPSLDGASCKIEWKITVHGVIRRWPDVKLEFPVTVLPLTTRGVA